jgi:hypothetical protein
VQTSIFIARMIGPVLVAIGLAFLIDPARGRRLASEFVDGEAPLFLTGMLTLLAGLAIVNTHNVWIAAWQVVVTLFGWLMVVAGFARLLLPDQMKVIGRAMLARDTGVWVPAALNVLLGLWLAWHGYL